MTRFLLAFLLLGSLRPALAQRLVTQTAALAAGQGVFLDLKHAHIIRVRPGAGLSVQARVSINDNQQNDLYSLRLQPAADELSVVETLDEEKLRQSRFTGDCDGGSRSNSSGGMNFGYTRSKKTGGLRPTVDYHKDGYSYCVKVDYDVTLPAGTALRLNTLSGDLELSGLSGAVVASTVSGDIKLSDLTGTVTAKAVSGDLTLNNLTGAVTVRSISGDVKLHNLGGNAVEASSVSGDVDLSWPPAQDAELSLKTVTGEVYADPTVTFSNLRAHSYVGYQLHGSYGSGSGSGPLVKLESVSGDVFFRKQQ